MTDILLAFLDLYSEAMLAIDFFSAIHLGQTHTAECMFVLQ